MRGKDDFTTLKIVKIGITPAYAGKSFVSGLNMNNQKDHPRLCGEKTTLRTVVQCDAVLSADTGIGT